MEIVIPNMEFDFNSARSSPRPSAPSSPKGFGQYYYTSAPTSPSRISDFYRDFDNLYGIDNDSAGYSSSPVAAAVQRSPKADEFAFNFSTDMEMASLTAADELFDGGRIRPLKPRPRSQAGDGQKSPLLSPRSPKSSNPFSQGKKIVRDVFSPRNKKKADPFTAGAENNTEKKTEHERGRPRRNDLSSGSRRASRSLSPYRVSEYPWEEEEKQYQRRQQQQNKQPATNSKLPPPHPPPSSSSSTKSSSRKWRFTDFLLFRSASEGRAAEKDPLRKYSGFKKNNEEIRNTTAASRSSEGSGSGRRKGQVSAHELHYTKNKAAAQDLKKKTFLPYKSGILGFHGFSRS